MFACTIKKTIIIVLITAFNISFVKLVVASNISVATDYSIDNQYTPHPEWRERVSPYNGSHTSQVITFSWPVPAKNKPEDQQNLSYEFTLSKQADLSHPIIHKTNLEWAFVNTHDVLPVGKYYWQYKRFRDGKLIETSDVMSVQQVAGETGFITPYPSELTNNIPAERPRLLATPASNQYIAQYKKESNKQAKAIIKKADSYFDVQLADKQYGGQFFKNGQRILKNKKFPDGHPKSKPTGRVFYQAIKTLAKAYLITGKEKYAQEGIRWSMQVANFPVNDVLTEGGANNFAQDDFDIAVLMPTLAVAYDTFYTQLSASEKKKVKAVLIERTEGFYQYFRNRLEARVMDNHAWQHTFSDFLRAAIALAGETPKADKYLEYAYGVWVARFPVQSITDGGWTNGKYVGVNFGTWTLVPLYLRRYAGVDYYQHPFFANQIEWLIARMPPKSWADGFGGDGFEDEKSIKNGTVDWLNNLNAELKDPRINWYLKQWQQKDIAKEVHWERMTSGLASDFQQPGNKNNLTNRFIFKDTGIVNSIESWQPLTTAVAFRSAPWGNFGHNLPSSNAFNILYAGEPLIYPTGYRHGGKKHAYEWYRNSRAHNTLMVNDKGQPVSSHAWGQLTQYLDDNDLMFVQGDASKAYSGEPSPQWHQRFSDAGVDWYKHVEDKSLHTYKRNLVHINGGWVIIYDEVAADNHAHWDWRFHSPKPMQLTSTGSLVKGKKGRAYSHFFASDKLEFDLTDKSLHTPTNVDGRKKDGVTAVYKDIGWHLNVANSGKKQYLLTIIDVAAKGTKARAVQKISDNQFSIDGASISVNLDPNQPAQLQVELDNGKQLSLRSGLAELKRL
ncbi:DUF4962 domain-containing protein [Paraferrimonas sp. SM1919]|uniref:DUF4962 domain-containing protein n=1 Tax=Paraferrimonas sp. SM1919 TaxID=2662263 RepID=UPI0013D681D9|nr:DUF4962 domain-containing protein [Paraferrimonas sp. SM1919]